MSEKEIGKRIAFEKKLFQEIVKGMMKTSDSSEYGTLCEKMTEQAKTIGHLISQLPKK